MDKENNRNKTRFQKRNDAGVCSRCNKGPLKTKRFCETCSVIINQKSRDYQNQINMLKAQDSRDVQALNQLNSAMISSDYDKLIKDRANIGTQITFLQNQIIQFQKNIPQ